MTAFALFSAATSDASPERRLALFVGGKLTQAGVEVMGGAGGDTSRVPLSLHAPLNSEDAVNPSGVSRPLLPGSRSRLSSPFLFCEQSHLRDAIL